MSRVLGTMSAPPAGVAASEHMSFAAAAAGAIGVLASLLRFGASSEALVTAALLGSLGVLAVIDFRRQLIPNRIVLPAVALVLALQLALFPGQALEWVLAALIAGGGLLALALLKSDSVGTGDAKVGMLLGAGLGAGAAWALLAGALLLWPVAAYLVFSEGMDARKNAIPLTPALAIGAAIVALG